MRQSKIAALALVALASVWASLAAAPQDPPQVKIPESGVPQVMTMEGKFVRAAYNNEGYVILGYQLANSLVGEEWMLLEFGITVRDGVPNYTLTRNALSLDTPDGKNLPLPTIMEHREANTAALENRAKVQRDSINYFPPSASQACGVVFFPDLTSRALPRDDIELSSQRACLGRLYFHVPGGIKYRAVLAERQVREEPRTGALQNSHRRGGEAPVEELQGHQQAGQGSLQKEAELTAGADHSVFDGCRAARGFGTRRIWPDMQRLLCPISLWLVSAAPRSAALDPRFRAAALSPSFLKASHRSPTSLDDGRGATLV